MTKKVIIDTDPGIDDAIALIFALKHPEIEILGITSVGGNKGLDNTTDNVTRILNAFDSNIKVYKGATHAYSSSVDPQYEMSLDYENETIHGVDGLGAVQLEKKDALIDGKDAVDFILESVEQHPGEIDIVALGPLTNLAYCIEKDEETMKKVKSIHSMGGGVHHGNRTPVAEFNYWFDPHAVNKVFELGIYLPVHMVGLDVTHQAVLDMNDLSFMKLTDPKLGGLLNDMLENYLTSYWENQRIIGAVVHDLTVMVGYMYPDIYTETFHANVNCVTDQSPAIGQTIIDLENRWTNLKNAHVPMQLDARKYKEKIIEVLFGEKSLEDYRQYV